MRKAIALLSSVFVIAFASAADARPRHHVHVAHYKSHVGTSHLVICDQRGCNDRASEGVQSSGQWSGAASSYLGMTASQIGLKRRSQWCSDFLIHVYHSSGVDSRAISWLNRPHVSPQVGAIAVMRHHVGIVEGFDANGNVILLSGNHNRKVDVGTYPRGRIIAFVSS
jgi:hypothetical protein